MKQEIIDRIKEEAKTEVKNVDPWSWADADNFIEGYIAGATTEATRAQGLVEALEGLINDVKSKPNDTRYATHLKKATNALAAYYGEEKKDNG